MPVYYTPPEKISEDALTIGGSEAHHILKVMRLKKGDAIMVVDGIGNCFRSEIGKYVKSELTCSIISRTRNFGEPSAFVTLAAGLSAGSKFDEIIQKGVELGISRFIPLTTEKSKVKINDPKKIKSRLGRWRKVAIAAMKQTGRSIIPMIEKPVQYHLFYNEFDDLGRKLLFDSSGEMTVYDLRPDNQNAQFTIIIGPESGFTRGEVEMAREWNSDILTLGSRVLRTENAAPTACALVMQILGEFR